MAKNGAGYDPDIEDVPPFVNDEDEEESEENIILRETIEEEE